jgi:hypothetical protein
MIRKSGNRFSEKIMRNQNARGQSIQFENAGALARIGAPLKSAPPIGLWRAGAVHITMTAQ